MLRKVKFVYFILALVGSVVLSILDFNLIFSFVLAIIYFPAAVASSWLSYTDKSNMTKVKVKNIDVLRMALILISGVVITLIKLFIR